MIANVYIAGFNLYYGCLKGTPYKWLDLEALAKRLLPKDNINRIRYFTARVDDRAGDSGAPRRQAVYLRGEPIRVVKDELKLPVGVVNPHPPHKRTAALRGTFFKQVRPTVLAACQLPPALTDSRGHFTRPATW